jgi:hypothetical protein
VISVLTGVFLVIVVVGGPLSLVAWLVRRHRRANENPPAR